MDEPVTRPARPAPALRGAAGRPDPEAALAAAERRLRALRGAALAGAGAYDPDAFDAALLAHRTALARVSAARRRRTDAGGPR